MNCPECNLNNKQRAEFEKNRRCGCCNGLREISFNRYVQWQIGWVLWLDGGVEASVSVMDKRCQSIIEDCFAKAGKKGRPSIKSYPYSDADPSEVTRFYANQFQGNDCLIL